MKPVDFEGVNCILAKDQPPYQPLPVMMDFDSNGCVTSCWRLTWWERLKLLVTGRLWLTQMTFNMASQAILPSVDCPIQYPDQSRGYG